MTPLFNFQILREHTLDLEMKLLGNVDHFEFTLAHAAIWTHPIFGNIRPTRAGRQPLGR